MSKLVIKFRCLCFFVAEPGDDPKFGRMHVVTPATCGCDGGVAKHEAFLVFPKAGGRLNAAGNIRAAGEEGKVDFVEMEGYAITFPDTGKAASLDLGASTVDLNEVTGDAIDPALVRGARDGRITSRITLPSGSMSSSVTPGTWDFNGKKIALARDVVWTIDGLADKPLVVRRSRFAVGDVPTPNGDEVVAEIRPNQRGEFRLEFHHSLEGDFGRPLKTLDPNAAAEHFAAYYDLYDHPAEKKPIPVFVSSPDVGVVGCLDAKGRVK